MGNLDYLVILSAVLTSMSNLYVMFC